jgi:hypothetical protein
MRRSAWSAARLVVALAGISAAAVARAEEPSPGKLARPAMSDTPLVIDGRLDEAVWQTAPVHDDFVERSPNLRGKPAERTTFRVLVDGARIYVGITCYDSQPGAIRARTMQRDSTALFDDLSPYIQAVSLERNTVGAIALTVMPCFAHSVASTRVSESVAPFEVQ